MLALPSFSGDLPASDLADLRARVQARVQPLLEKKQSVGLAVGIIAEGRRQVFGFGRERLEVDKAPDGRTIYEIGSVTKIFTSLALAQMAQEGLVRVDEPVQLLLPADVKIAPRGGREITLEDLATHTSGLPRIPIATLFTLLATGNPYAGYTEKNLDNFLRAWQPTEEIGTKWKYSNVGAGLLGHALARRAGMDFGRLIAERVTGPLGLRDTVIALSEDQERRLASPYDVGNEPSVRWTFDVLAGAGALHSTADDLLELLAAEMGLRETSLRKAMDASLVPRRHTGMKGLDIGLGWLISSSAKADDADKVYWHNGGTGGYASFVAFDARRKTAVVLLSNTGLSLGSIGALDQAGSALLQFLKDKDGAAR